MSKLEEIKQTSQQKFNIHPAVIFSLLTKQASGVPKALLELVMNSVDAGASRIDIEINEKGYIVADNGRGFKDIEEIKNMFGVFGQPHVAGDALYGRFRLGRAQSYALSRTQWFTKDFCMEVDLNIEIDQQDPNIPLGYFVKEGLPYYQGCKIVGEFYRPQNVGAVEDYLGLDGHVTPESVDQVIPALIKLSRYVPVPVYINGHLISLNVQGAGVDVLAETDMAYFILKPLLTNEQVGVVNVYNQGVYAYQLRSKHFKGDVVSKLAIDLNMARNEAKTDCAVANSIRFKLAAMDRKVMLDQTEPDVDERQAQKKRVLNQASFVDEVWSMLLGLTPFSQDAHWVDLNKKAILLGDDTKVSFKQIVSALKQLDSCMQREIFIYEMDALNQSMDLDVLCLENAFFPKGIFPSDALIEKLNFTVNLYPAMARRFEEVISMPHLSGMGMDFDEFYASKGFDFSGELSLSEKRLGLLKILVNSYDLMDYFATRMNWRSFYHTFLEKFTVSSLEGDSELLVNKLLETKPPVCLNEFEKMVLGRLNGLSLETDMLPVIRGNEFNLQRKVTVRNIMASDVLAYTDGSSSIVLSESFFKDAVAKGEFESILMVLIHEFCHKNDSTKTHQHGATFYQFFRKVATGYFYIISSNFYRDMAVQVEKKLTAKNAVTQTVLEKLKISDAALKRIAEKRLEQRIRLRG